MNLPVVRTLEGFAARFQQLFEVLVVRGRRFAAFAIGALLLDAQVRDDLVEHFGDAFRFAPLLGDRFVEAVDGLALVGVLDFELGNAGLKGGCV